MSVTVSVCLHEYIHEPKLRLTCTEEQVIDSMETVLLLGRSGTGKAICNANTDGLSSYRWSLLAQYALAHAARRGTQSSEGLGFGRQCALELQRFVLVTCHSSATCFLLCLLRDAAEQVRAPWMLLSSGLS